MGGEVMDDVERSIYCASGELRNLCERPKCDREVCGCCCYCGRPVCKEHGWHDADHERYYCNQHGPNNHVRVTVETVAAAFTIAKEQGIDITEIGTKELADGIMHMLKLKYPPSRV